MHQPLDTISRPGRWNELQSGAPRGGRRRLIVIAAIVGVALIAALLMFSGRGGAPAPAAGNAANVPVVTVIVPGRTQVADTVGVTGSIAALHDMPVGVQGEGGAVTAVLVNAGDHVAAGQTLARIDPSVETQQVNQLRAAVAQARADAKLAQSELDRAQALVSRGFISKADIDRKTAARDSANARVAVAAAQQREAQARLARLSVRAPAAGLVLDRSVEPGQVVGPGSGALFRIAENSVFEMKAQVAEGDLARLKAGMSAAVTPIGQSSAVPGTIWQVSPIVDPGSRQGIARIRLEPSDDLRPGGFARADIVAGQTDAPLLPESAVMNEDSGNYVYIVGADNKVARRKVKIGAVNDRGVVIAGGLDGSERVVLSAGAFLNPGETIKPVAAE